MSEQLRLFNSYEDYLDSHLVDEDLYYLKVAIESNLYFWNEIFWRILNPQD